MLGLFILKYFSNLRKRKEEAEKKERNRRIRERNWKKSSWMSRIISYVPVKRITTVAAITVFVGVAAIIYKNGGNKMLPLTW